MKKIMSIIAAVVASAAVADGLASSTIVGYNTVAAPEAGKFKALSLQFDDVGGVTSIPVTNLVKVAAPKGAPAFNAAADQIWTYDITGGWNKYYYRTASKNWCKQGQNTITTDVLNRTSGSTIFFRRGGGGAATTLTLSGAVKPFEASQVYSGITAGTFRFIAYPWPVPFTLDNLKNCQAAPKAAPAFNAAADQVWTYDMEANTWVKYFYRTASKGYCRQGTTTITDAVVPAGEGFFFRRGGGGATETITFTYSAE